MQTITQLTDFDLQITDILLVHRNQFINKFSWNYYKSGRKIDGLVLCICGEAEFLFPDVRITLHPGQVMFLSANDAYTVQCAGETPFIHYTVNFRMIPDHECMEQNPILASLCSGTYRYLTNEVNYHQYEPEFAQLLSVWQTKNSGYRMMAKSILYRILYKYLSDVGHDLYYSDPYHRLIPAQELLDTKFTENYSIASLAALCGMSETHFRRMFHKLYGCTPSEYRLQKRLLRAKDLLLSGEYSVLEAAHSVGFSDGNYFARRFKQENGMSPTAFIKQMIVEDGWS